MVCALHTVQGLSSMDWSDGACQEHLLRAVSDVRAQVKRLVRWQQDQSHRPFALHEATLHYATTFPSKAAGR